MTSLLKRNYGNRTFNLAELQYFRVHVYATFAQLNADVSTAVGRIAYCVATDRVYFGQQGTWVGVANSSSWQDPVANVGALPGTDVDGTVRVVLDDGTAVGPTIWMYSAAHGGWHKVGDPGIVLANGTVKFTAIPGVINSGVVPVAGTDLTPKLYVDTATAAAQAAAISAAEAFATAADVTVLSSAETYAAAQAATAQSNAEAYTDAQIVIAEAAAAAALAAHEADGTAHSTEINALIAAHNSDPTSHLAGIAGPASGGGGGGSTPSGGADGAFSLSGQNVIENARVVNGGHGSPCVTNPYESVYMMATELVEPCGMIWRPSSTISFGSGSVTFTNSGANILMTTTTGLVPGQVLLFPGSALNTGIYFTVTAVVDGFNVTVSPAPTDETVASTMTAFNDDGIVLFSGKFFIDNPISFGAQAIQSASMSVGGFGQIVISSFTRFNAIRAGDQVVIAGTPSNDGTYIVKTTNQATFSITLTVTLTANQASPAGTATITHLGQSHNFIAFSTPGQVDTPFYTLDSDPLEYNTTPGAWELGQQTNSSEFVIRIQRGPGTKVTAVTSAGPISRKLKQVVPVDTSGGGFAITLFTGLPGDQFTIIDYGNSLASNNLTINSDGAQQFGPGASTSVVLSTNGQSITYTFLDGKWRISVGY